MGDERLGLTEDDIPEGLTPEARRERKAFIERRKYHLEQEKKLALSILVWGPSPNRTGPVAKKRIQIRAELIRQGHNAMFSEEFDGPASDDFSLKARELAEARAAHLVIALPEDSPGTWAEVHDFCTDPEVASKVLLFMPRAHAAGYSALGAVRDLEEANPNAVHWYDEQALVECSLLNTTLRKAAAFRRLYFSAQRGSAGGRR